MATRNYNGDRRSPGEVQSAVQIPIGQQCFPGVIRRGWAGSEGTMEAARLLMRFPGVGYAPTPVNNACELSVSVQHYSVSERQRPVQPTRYSNDDDDDDCVPS